MITDILYNKFLWSYKFIFIWCTQTYVWKFVQVLRKLCWYVIHTSLLLRPQEGCIFIFCCIDWLNVYLMPLSGAGQLNLHDHIWWWRKLKFPEKSTNQCGQLYNFKPVCVFWFYFYMHIKYCGNVLQLI